jgi:hypothetical protein
MKALLFTSFYAAAIGVVGNIGERFLRERTRIVSQDAKSIEGKVITWYRQGAKTWATTNDVVVVNRPVERPVKYSKLKLIVAAKSVGKWDSLKAAISAMGIEDEWNACQYITSDYPAYISATNAVIQNGIATEAEVKAFMKLAED